VGDGERLGVVGVGVLGLSNELGDGEGKEGVGAGMGLELVIGGINGELPLIVGLYNSAKSSRYLEEGEEDSGLIVEVASDEEDLKPKKYACRCW